MAATLLFAGALLAQSAGAIVSIGTEAAPSLDKVDVGYEALMQGRPNEALARIRGNSRLETSDPAALINIGAAFVQLGQTDKAQASYMAAIASTNRYDLELADGKWMDSRRAARLALKRLDSGQALALR